MLQTATLLIMKMKKKCFLPSVIYKCVFHDYVGSRFFLKVILYQPVRSLEYIVIQQSNSYVNLSPI